MQNITIYLFFKKKNLYENLLAGPLKLGALKLVSPKLEGPQAAAYTSL